MHESYVRRRKEEERDVMRNQSGPGEGGGGGGGGLFMLAVNTPLYYVDVIFLLVWFPNFSCWLLKEAGLGCFHLTFVVGDTKKRGPSPGSRGQASTNVSELTSVLA